MRSNLAKIKDLEALFVGGAPTPYRLIEKIVHLLPNTDSLCSTGLLRQNLSLK